MFKNWKNWVVFKPVVDFYHSLFNNNLGFSFRKGAAVFALWTAREISLNITDSAQMVACAASWKIFAAVCIGLVTIPELIKFLSIKGGTNDGPKEG